MTHLPFLTVGRGLTADAQFSCKVYPKRRTLVFLLCLLVPGVADQEWAVRISHTGLFVGKHLYCFKMRDLKDTQTASPFKQA